MAGLVADLHQIDAALYRRRAQTPTASCGRQRSQGRRQAWRRQPWPRWLGCGHLVAGPYRWAPMKTCRNTAPSPMLAASSQASRAITGHACHLWNAHQTPQRFVSRTQIVLRVYLAREWVLWTRTRDEVTNRAAVSRYLQYEPAVRAWEHVEGTPRRPFRKGSAVPTPQAGGAIAAAGT